MSEDKLLRRAKDLAYRCLSVRDRSRAEVAAYLEKKGVPADVAERALAGLAGDGYIDDRRFAASYARYLVDRKGLSRYALKAELLKKGVSKDDIAAALQSTTDDMPDDESVAVRMAGKKAASLRGVDKEKARRRLVDYLRRRGFSFDVIRKALKNTDQ